MKKFLFRLFLACYSFYSYGQELPPKNASASTVDPRIVEVFGEQLQTLILESDVRRKAYESILGRMEIVESPFNAKEKLKKLSAMKLFNRYNPKLERDEVFDPKTFNALKYVLPVSSPVEEYIRIDNTNYLLVIHSQKKK